MSHQEYMRYLRQNLPNHESCEVQSRTYKNAKGVDEIIFLTSGYWAYVDWLEARGDISFADWVVHCDLNRFEDWCLSHLLHHWLWTDECNRFRQGLPTPNPYPPMGYEGWADEFHGKAS
jgi:hypothetical protein